MKIAILGFGTIGSGVYEVIETNYDIIAKRTGEEISVKYVLDLRDFPGQPVEKVLVHDFNVIVNDPEVETVVETMGGTKPAYDFVKACLLAGKSVCTSNKELVAKHGAELLEIARENKINFLFEASVGGAIPIIRPLMQSITADKILEITGILNGTTNFMLTKMDREGAQYEDVLKDAQARGYAERNPAADVEGYDAGRKIAILTSLAYGKQVDFEDVYMEGITKISAEDFKYAEALGAKIKLLGSSKLVGDKVTASVSPRMIRDDNPLFSVSDVFNAILVKGNVMGNAMFYGSGAGKLPTASAVVADVIDATKHRGKNIMVFWDKDKMEVASQEDVCHSFFVRVKAADKDNAIKAFGKVNEIKSVVDGEFAFLTSVMSEKAFALAAEKVEIINRIRTEFEA